MPLTLIEPPAAEPVSLTEAKAFARVEDADEDALIESLIGAATELVQTTTARQLVLATYDYYRDEFPACGKGIRLPISPLNQVESVNYVSPDTGMETVLAGTEYEVDTASQPGWIMPKDGRWPATMSTINAVRVRFKAGYPPSDDSPIDHAANIPARAKVAVKALVHLWYDERVPVPDTPRVTEMPLHVSRLLRSLRVWSR